MSWRYEEGRYHAEDGSWFCFWINEALGYVSLDWRTPIEGRTYGSDGMKLKLEDNLEEIAKGVLNQDVLGFLDSLKAGCINQVMVKIGQESECEESESIA